MKRVDVACCLLFDDAGEKILLVKNKHGDSSYWSIPGGAVEDRETLEQAARRETKEETGLDIETTGLASVREAFFTDRGHHAVIFTFFAKIIGGRIHISDPDDDILEVRWMEIEQANELMPYLPDCLKYYSGQQKIKVPYFFHGTIKTG